MALYIILRTDGQVARSFHSYSVFDEGLHSTKTREPHILQPTFLSRAA